MVPNNRLCQPIAHNRIDEIIPRNGHKILCFAPAITEKIDVIVAINVNQVDQSAYFFIPGQQAN